MELVPAGIPLTFEVTFDSPSLHVGMTVYETTGASPVLLLSPFAMTWVYGNTYVAKFTPQAGRSYVIIKGVYTSSALTTLSPDYSQGSESVYAQYFQPQPVGEVVGYVDNPAAVVGIVECA